MVITKRAVIAIICTLFGLSVGSGMRAMLEAHSQPHYAAVQNPPDSLPSGIELILVETDRMIRVTDIRVVDGDTIEGDLHLTTELNVEVILKEEKIRLLRVDTWEVTGPNAVKGQKATEFVRMVLSLGPVYLRLGERRRGKYGRILGTVYVSYRGGWIDLQDALLHNGHVKPVRAPQ